MKKVFGFFTNKGSKSVGFKILVSILAVATLLSVGFLIFRSRGDFDLQALSRQLNTYNLELVYNQENKSFSASQKLEYENKTGENLNNLNFHLYITAFKENAVNKPVGTLNVDGAYPNGFSYATFNVNSVQVNGKAVQFETIGEDGNILDVKLADTLSAGKKVTVKIDFDFTMPNVNHRFGYGENTINVANFYPILCVYENGAFVIDAYHYNGDPFYSDMSNYNVKLTVPTSYVVAHTGEEISSEMVLGNKVITIGAKAVRDFAFVMSNKFNVISQQSDNTLIKYYYYNDSNAEASLKAGVDSIKTFSELFGEYPYSTYSVVQTNFVHGGMEFPNLSYISDAVSKHSDYVNVIIHETAHQWWYQMVGSNAFRYPWLDEGLTEFSTLMFYEKNPSYNVDSSDIVINSTNSYVSFIELCESILGSVDTSMNRALNEYDTEPEYVYVTYVKGMLLFENLRELIGKPAFDKGLKAYYLNYRFKNATPENLIATFEKASLKSLNSFFNSWTEGKVLIKNM